MNKTQTMMWNGTVRALPWQEQLNAAAAGGCDALSITPSDYYRWLAHGLSTRDMLTMADDAGVKVTHLDPFVRWVDQWRPDMPESEFPTDAIAFDVDDFFRLANVLGVRSFTAWAGFPEGRYSVPQITDAFGALCSRAEKEGLRCDLEFIPVFGIPNLKMAWDIVQGAGAPNSGIMLDLWHYIRGGRDDALLRSIPGDKIGGLQLCDATMKVPDGMSLVFDGLNNRTAPGDGEFPIKDIVDVLRETGGLNVVGLEVFSSKFDAMSAAEIAQISKNNLKQTLRTI